MDNSVSIKSGSVLKILKAFSHVLPAVHATWRGLDVVAKMLKTSDQESTISKSVAKADLINEISVLSRHAPPP